MTTPNPAALVPLYEACKELVARKEMVTGNPGYAGSDGRYERARSALRLADAPAAKEGEAIDWGKRVMDMVCRMPMGHTIDNYEMRFTYNGQTYNNALDCFTRHVVAELEKAYAAGASSRPSPSPSLVEAAKAIDAAVTAIPPQSRPQWLVGLVLDLRAALEGGA